MAYNYSVKNLEKEHTARAAGKALPISIKHSVEVCNFIRFLQLQKAKKFLQEVINQKRAVPYKQYNIGISHKKSIGPGRYPINTCKEILKILESAESNAQFKGLNTANLVINHLSAHKASTPWHYGRHRGKMKRTDIQIILEEKTLKEKAKEAPKEKKEKKTEKIIAETEEKKEEKTKTKKESKEEIKK